MADIDATNFITAAGLTDSTQISAIETLVADLKTNNLWDKLYAIYPFVGGTATSHKWNLKNPQDTNEAYRLIFSGGITHSSTGAAPNGTNAFADTFLIQSLDNFPIPSYISFGYYSRTGGVGPGGEAVIGSFNNPSSQFVRGSMVIKGSASPNVSAVSFTYPDGIPPIAVATTLIIRIQTVLLSSLTRLNGILKASISAVSPITNVGDALGTGMYIGTRSSSGVKLFARGAEISNNFSGTPNNLNPTGLSAYLFAYNDKGTRAFNFSIRECAFAHIGAGLTSAECITLTTIVESFQITLGRNV